MAADLHWGRAKRLLKNVTGLQSKEKATAPCPDEPHSGRTPKLLRNQCGRVFSTTQENV